MRCWFLPLAAVLCLCTGCLSAVREAEQAIRRGQTADAPDAPTRRAVVSVDDLPQLLAGEVRVDPGHPRLYLGRSPNRAIPGRREPTPVQREWPAASSSLARQWRAALQAGADQAAAGPLIGYSADRLLTRSREALRRLSRYGAVYRFTKEKKFADAGRRELLNVCNFDDWQPDAFLATAEMMTAASIGYDWLHDALTPAERKTVVNAIGRLGLRPALDAYTSRGGWTRAQHNWNLVCNGGVIVASLAIYEEDPQLARDTLSRALESIRYGLSAYDRDGGTAEGPMYHSYATRYLTFAAAALHSAADDDRLIFLARPRDAVAHWAGAGDYRLLMTGPTGKSANFGDSSETLGNTAWMLWHARRFDRPDYQAFQIEADRHDPSAFDLLWYDPRDQNRPSPSQQPRRVAGPAFILGTSVVMRDWTWRAGPEAGQTFLALRTGSTADHHSHLDLGNFVLDMLGERFALDLGADNYDLPGYLGPHRADYLRSSTPGHNTLSLGDASQPLDAATTAALASDGKSVRIDLTAAYPGVSSITRTAALDGRVATITDDIRMKLPSEIVWNLHTPARVITTRTGAILELNGKQVALTVLEPGNGKLTTQPAATRPPQLSVEGVTQVRLRVKVEGPTRIKIQFRPIGN